MNFDIKRIKYEHNLGANDKKIRMIAGCVLLGLTLFLGSVTLLILGVALVASSYWSWCPVYSGLGKNTCDAPSAEAPAKTESAAEPAETKPAASKAAPAEETKEAETTSETEDTH